MDFTTHFSDCLSFLGLLFENILTFMDSIIIAPNISLLGFSLGLSLFALVAKLITGLFGGSDR